MSHAARLFAAALACADAAAAAVAPASPISPELDRVLAAAPDGHADMLVVLRDQADLSLAPRIDGNTVRSRYAFERLTSLAAREQGALLAELERLGVPHRAFWIANFVLVEGDRALARRLAARPEVARLEANERWRAVEPLRVEAAERSVETVEPGIAHIRAPEVWARGYTGNGAVVGIIDTGVRWTHAALKSQYRGWNGASANHNYRWHDAIHTGGGSCGANAVAPCDAHGHGTQVLGVAVGDEGGANQIGVAPTAKWIACRAIDESGVGTVATYTECLQWMVAPTNLAGAGADPAQAPDVVNNSWNCTAAQGCTTPDVLKTVFENVRAAGVLLVAAAGNGGPACSTVDTPPAIYAANLAIGAADNSDVPAGFSSRGPVTVDGSNRLKPDFVAPGVNVRSALATSDSSYGTASGTSLAAPHVTGLVALEVSMAAEFAGQPDLMENLLLGGTIHPATSSQICGGISATTFPNNTLGKGRIDALGTSDLLLTSDHTVFRDGFELRGTARWTLTHP